MAILIPSVACSFKKMLFGNMHLQFLPFLTVCLKFIPCRVYSMCHKLNRGMLKKLQGCTEKDTCAHFWGKTNALNRFF